MGLRLLLVLDPTARTSASEALAHAYFAELADDPDGDEQPPVAAFKFDFEDRPLSTATLKQLVAAEMRSHPAEQQRCQGDKDLLKQQEPPQSQMSLQQPESLPQPPQSPAPLQHEQQAQHKQAEVARPYGWFPM